jgi:hypothetical protein
MDTLPSWMNAAKLLMISGVTLSTVQYIKQFIPEKWVKPIAIPAAILIAFLLEFAETNLYVKLSVYGLFAVVIADTGYKFVNNTRASPAFSLPSKAQEEAGEKKP